MSAVTKKPLPGSSPSTSPARQPPAQRAATPTGSASPSSASTTTGAGLGRTRSLRTSNPVSARQAAAARRESPLSNSTTSAGANGSGNGEQKQSQQEQQDALAETVAALDDVKERLAKAETSGEQLRKQNEVLQARLEDALKEQATLEEKVHEGEEQGEALRNEKREAARQMREMEAIYEAERSAMTKEKEEMANREEEMQTVIQRLKDSLAQRNVDEEPRASRQANNSSPSVEGGNFAPPSSLHRSDSRNNSKLLLQKDRLIESLRLELAEAQIKLVESENQGGGRLHEVERQLVEARMANARLMEDNESYQLLLQERTLHGDFGKGDFSYMRPPSSGNSPRHHQDALNALEGRSPKLHASGAGSGKGGETASVGTSLADELSEANLDPPDSADSTKNAGGGDAYRRLETELRAAKDQNKALTLYINKIIERLLQHQDFEHILDQSSDGGKGGGPNMNKDLPPPPPEKAAGPSLLQRAKSIAVGATNAVGSAAASSRAAGAPARPRPMSVMPSASSTQPNPNGNTDPVTAPSIPIGPFSNLTRSSSTRRSRPMSEQFTGAGGSSLVNQMYRPSESGPVSPTLGDPRRSSTFFVSSNLSGSVLTNSTSNTGSASGTATPRTSGTGGGSTGNFPGMRSETSSTSGDSTTGGEVTTPPSQSPPREKAGATTFAGGKPRPLRLVQENPDALKAEAGKRGSWIGNMGWNWGGKKDEPGSGGSESIPE